MLSGGRRTRLLLGLVLLAAAALRLYGLNWDGGHWLHPDERQIYFLALDLSWPASLEQALSPASPLNPGFFAYGSLPIYVLRGMAELLALMWSALRDPGSLHVAGRVLSAALDVGTVALTYRLGRGKLASSESANRNVGLVAAGLVAVAMIHVQSAHFYITDVMLTFLVMLALDLAFETARGAGKRVQVALGIVTGLALATKITAAPLLLLPAVAYPIRRGQAAYPKSESSYSFISQLLLPTSLTFLLAGVTFVLFQPYALIDWGTFLSDTVREAQIASGRLDAPYTQQYAHTWPYLYQMWQITLWGLGLPIGVTAWIGFGALVTRWLRRGEAADTLLIAWAGPYFALTGMLYAKPLRYMLPVVPVLCVLAAWQMHRWGRTARKRFGNGRSVSRVGFSIMLVVALGYASVFVAMYTEAHPWIEASEWIYREVGEGSVIAVEDWDTPLPLALEIDGRARWIGEYSMRTLKLYGKPDDAAKWQAIVEDLAQSDYVIIASRRLYGSIPRVPARYPIAAHYHDLLFGRDLGFVLAEEFTRGPSWLNPRVSPLPDAAPQALVPDETVVVYDHPRTLVFRNVARLPADVLFERVIAASLEADR